MSVSARTPNDHTTADADKGRVVKPRAEQQLGPEVRRGRGLPFAQVVTQWVRDSRYSANLRTLYAILVTYADVRTRDTSKGRPYRSVLASELGVSESTLDRTIREGETAGLFRVEHRTNPLNPLSNEANIYHLRDEDFWANDWIDPLRPDQKAAVVAEAARKHRATEKRAAGILPKGGRKKKTGSDQPSTPPKDGGGVMGDATQKSVENRGGGVMGDARGGVMGDALYLEPLIESLNQDLSLSPLEQNLTNRAGAVRKGEERDQDLSMINSIPSQRPEPDDVQTHAEVVVRAYADALGRPVINGTRTTLTRQALDLLSAGFPVPWLAERARELATNGWTDLLKHAERSTVPIDPSNPKSPPGGLSGPASARRTAIDACRLCDYNGMTDEDAPRRCTHPDNLAVS